MVRRYQQLKVPYIQKSPLRRAFFLPFSLLPCSPLPRTVSQLGHGGWPGVRFPSPDENRAARSASAGVSPRPRTRSLLLSPSRPLTLSHLSSPPLSFWLLLPLCLFLLYSRAFFRGNEKGPRHKPQALSLFFPFYLNPCVQGDQASVMLPTMAASMVSSIWAFSRLRI